MSRIQRIIFNETSLEHALSAVRGLHDMSTELIAADVFRQMSELVTYKLTPATVWCGRGGLYQSKLEAISNGEQQIESAILIDEPDLAGLAIDAVEVGRLVAANTEYARRHLEQLGEVEQLREDNLHHRNLQIEADDLIKSLRAGRAERDALLRDCFTVMLKGGYSKPLRERIKAALGCKP